MTRSWPGTSLSLQSAGQATHKVRAALISASAPSNDLALAAAVTPSSAPSAAIAVITATSTPGTSAATRTAALALVHLNVHCNHLSASSHRGLDVEADPVAPTETASLDLFPKFHVRHVLSV
eukprot:CAMPEP_0194481314 /NCGR_PEP_ID=MMETSP0253-20130528/3796_1 /TAXON_ID=2966 /ORGANISM="Noctiluca scintillans" /LENGTH=121 /DNA_ID=CAMNT_0039320789 /DNA_START=56 /DNA_END=422 /DNA_ORIENTATION=+